MWRNLGRSLPETHMTHTARNICTRLVLWIIFIGAEKELELLKPVLTMVKEIFTYLYYANEERDDVIDGSTKTVQHSIINISRNIGAVFFKLGTRNVHHKRKRMTP